MDPGAPPAEGEDVHVPQFQYKPAGADWTVLGHIKRRVTCVSENQKRHYAVEPFRFVGVALAARAELIRQGAVGAAAAHVASGYMCKHIGLAAATYIVMDFAEDAVTDILTAWPLVRGTGVWIHEGLWPREHFLDGWLTLAAGRMFLQPLETVARGLAAAALVPPGAPPGPGPAAFDRSTWALVCGLGLRSPWMTFVPEFALRVLRNCGFGVGYLTRMTKRASKAELLSWKLANEVLAKQSASPAPMPAGKLPPLWVHLGITVFHQAGISATFWVATSVGSRMVAAMMCKGNTPYAGFIDCLWQTGLRGLLDGILPGMGAHFIVGLLTKATEVLRIHRAHWTREEEFLKYVERTGKAGVGGDSDS